MAIGAGQIFGNGVKNLKVYVPEAQTDMIFSIIGKPLVLSAAHLWSSCSSS